MAIYLSVCGSYDRDLEPGDLYGSLADRIEWYIYTMSDLYPPHELIEWHDANIAAHTEFLHAVRTMPRDMPVGDEYVDLAPPLEPYYEALEQVERNLPVRVIKALREARL